MIKVYEARELWNLDKDSVWALPDGKMKVKFDDGEIVETTNRVVILSYYLGIYHRLFPKTPLLSRHLIKPPLVKGMEIKILGKCLFDCKDAYAEKLDLSPMVRDYLTTKGCSNYAPMEILKFIAFRAINDIYNDFTSRLKSYVSSTSILDYIEIIKNPDIMKIKENIPQTKYGINKAYKEITNVLNTPGAFSKNNDVIRMVESNLVSLHQVLQCIGPRGFLSDIDGNIFRKPIMNGLIDGFVKLLDKAMESRSAARSLIFSGSDTATSEYFSRELQLMASTLTRLHPGDCGSQDYLIFKVKAGDLDNIKGKYYLDESDNTLKEITMEDRHLVGKIIKLRSPTKCHHPDSYGVCSTCMGSLSLSIPNNANLGHIAVIQLCEILTQMLLSTKHLEKSAAGDEVIISEYDAKFITPEVTEDEIFLKLNDALAGKDISIIVEERQAHNLPDISYHRDISVLTPSTITSINEILIVIKENDDVVKVPVALGIGNQFAWLTGDALKYIKEKGWIVTDDGHYQINLKDWDNNLPLFQLPDKNADLLQYITRVKSFIMSSKSTGKSKSNKTLKECPNVNRSVYEFYNLISSKVSINLAYLELITLSCMIRDEEKRDYRLPSPATTGQIGSYNDLMSERSIAVVMAHESQKKLFFNINSYINKQRPDSPYDNLLCPFPKHNPRL